MKQFRKTPPSVSNHRYSEIFAKEWQKIHNRMDGNSFNFFIGGNGTGKSYAALKRSEIIGVDENDCYGKLFDPDHLENHVFFDKQDMMAKIAELEKKPLEETRGYQIILDEAQVSANAKEWNNREVLNFSKDMTTIRSARLSICLTMPTHRMITTDLRQLGIYQVEMFPAEKLDLSRGISYSKIHYLKLNPHSGEIWRYRPVITFKSKSIVTGETIVKRGRLNQIAWKLPNRTIRKNYEEMKKAFRDKRNEQNAKANVLSTAKEKRKTLFQNALEKVKSNIDKYRQPDGSLSWYLVMKDPEIDCGRDTANRVISWLKYDGVI